jgi:hypothetical protein
MASGEEEIILDSEDKRSNPALVGDKLTWLTFLRYLAVLSFIVGLLMRLESDTRASAFLIAGTVIFVVWSAGRFLSRYRYSKLEWLIFPGRVLLISGLFLRYFSDWRYAIWLVLAGLFLWSFAIMLSINSGKGIA